jgi:3',5'-nucleoside bisphosphate phosphatase
VEGSAPAFDLQCHSVHSDGALAPAEVVKRAADEGVRTLALTDHDTIDGLAEALQAARVNRIKLVPAVEISAVQDEHEDLHILGYGIDPSHPELRTSLSEYRGDREARAHRMANALKESGYEVKQALLDKRKQEGKPIGRPHLAQAVLAHPANTARLELEGIDDVSALIEAQLIPGKPSYRRRTFPTVQQAIDLIHQAGGVAVWAHPFWDLAEDDEVLDTLARFRRQGLDGVEAFYVTHTEHQTHLLVDAAERSDLLTTGSSDFHGPDHRLFSRFRAFELHGRTPNLDGLGA